MIEFFEELRTCDDVRAFGLGISEGLRMNYKESLRLTKGGRKELAKDVSALANAEGGLLVKYRDSAIGTKFRDGLGNFRDILSGHSPRAPYSSVF